MPSIILTPNGRHLTNPEGEAAITFARSLDGRTLALAKRAITEVTAMTDPAGQPLIEVRGTHLYLDPTTWLACCMDEGVAERASLALRAERVMEGRFLIVAGHQRLGEVFGTRGHWLAEHHGRCVEGLRFRSMRDAGRALWTLEVMQPPHTETGS
jgi:hypothetical protein